MEKEFDLYQPLRAPLYPLKFFFSLWAQSEWINHNDSVPVGAESQHLSLLVLCSSLPPADDERRSPCGCGTWQQTTQRWTILPLREEKGTLIISDPYLLTTGDPFLIFSSSNHFLRPLLVLRCPPLLSLSLLLATRRKCWCLSPIAIRNLLFILFSFLNCPKLTPLFDSFSPLSDSSCLSEKNEISLY